MIQHQREQGFAGVARAGAIFANLIRPFLIAQSAKCFELYSMCLDLLLPEGWRHRMNQASHFDEWE